MQYIIPAAILLALFSGYFLFWGRVAGSADAEQAEPAARLVAIVVLAKAPKYVDSRILATTAGRAWGMDLGDGDTEGPDGLVAGEAPIMMVMCRDKLHMVHSRNTPYIDSPADRADDMVDGRLQRVITSHTAWFSCDAMGVDHDTPDSEVRDSYRRLGSLIAELLDEDSLGIYFPDTQALFAVNEQTEECLRSDDPLQSLQQSADLPMIQVPNDDPRMQAAVEQARHRWIEFATAFEEQAGQNFNVKAPITRGNNTEFIWISVTAIENDVIYGKLGNDPVDLPGLKLGSQVRTTVSELNDWAYLNAHEQVIGGFTIQVVLNVAREQRSRPKGK